MSRKSIEFFTTPGLVVVFLFLSCNVLLSRANDPGWAIEFVRQAPSDTVRQKIPVIQRLMHFITGKETLSLVRPYAAVADQHGNLWVIDQWLHALCKIDEANRIKASALKSAEKLPSPVGLAWLDSRTLLVTDSKLGRIYRYNVRSKKVKRFAAQIQWSRPTGIAASPDGRNVWIVDTGAHQIVVATAAGEFVRRIGKRGEGQGEFNFPTFICADDSLFYVVDSMNFRIQIFDQNGVFVRSFGEVGDGEGYLSRPKGIAVDTFGHIYIVDGVQHNIQVFDQNGLFLYAWGALGTKPGQFWLPSTIFIDRRNMIYIADTFNKRLQVFRLTSGSANE